MEEQFRKFWKWFVNHESMLHNVSGRAEVHDELGARLADLGFFDWELGPSDEVGKKYYLTIQLSDYDDYGMHFRGSFLSSAPEFPEWEFLTSRPPKKWSRRLVWGKTRVPIDASNWIFSLYRYDDGKYDIVLNSPLPSDISKEDSRNLVICVLVSELGDAVLNEKVNAIDVEEKKASVLKRGIPINEVRNVLLDDY